MATFIRTISRNCLPGNGKYFISSSYLHNCKYNTLCYGTVNLNQTNKHAFTSSHNLKFVNHVPVKYFCEKVNVTEAKETKAESKEKELTRKEKLKLAVKEYGSTVIIFHVTISLISLGTCYMLVSSGIDVESLCNYIGLSSEKASKLATTSGTFVAAYAIHKVFAPVRISITLGATPFIVRYLRHKGWIKKP